MTNQAEMKKGMSQQFEAKGMLTPWDFIEKMQLARVKQGLNPGTGRFPG